jgi:predicted protein tyrosine phosphatase
MVEGKIVRWAVPLDVDWHADRVGLCSAGLLRSATGAHIFSAPPYNWNTRTAGVALEYALNPVNEALLYWADRIYVMEERHVRILKEIFGEERYEDAVGDKLRVLNIPDEFNYRNPELIACLEQAVSKLEASDVDALTDNA